MKRFFFALSLLILPSFTYAQSGGLQLFFKNLLAFINSTLIPFILGIGFLVFVINAFRYFILQGDSDDGREKAKSLALYSVFAFVLVVIFWGMVNLLASSTGLEGKAAPEFDYIEATKGSATPPPATTP